MHSDLGLQLEIYGGDWEEPNPGNQISSLSIGSGGTEFVWLRVAIPAGVTGAETVRLEASVDASPAIPK